MRKLLGSVAALVGFAVTLSAGWLLVRGPFFGGPVPTNNSMFAALVGFIGGVVLLGWGSVRLAGVGARV